MEKTFFIIKPDGLKYLDKIITLFVANKLDILEIRRVKATMEQLNKHYAHITDKPFYKDVVKYMTSDFIYVGILEKENAVEDLRKLMGSTKPEEADKGTIRNLYGFTDKETGNIFNVIHGSDSIENAKKEMKIWI